MNYKLSIVVPCYNEKDNIENIINKIKESQVEDKEIIVVDDFSSDGTREILENKIKKEVDKVIYHEVNMGKGAALRTGFSEATGDYVIIQDADLEYDPKEYPLILNKMIELNADVVYGSRFLNAKSKGYLANRIANKFLTNISNVTTGQKLTDMETCYKCFKRDVIQSIDLTEDRFGFEPEVTAKISKKGIKIVEVPITYNPRTNEEGKKIGFKDGLRAIYCILKYR